MTRLSICIPTYNRDVYLESLLARVFEERAGRDDRVQVVVSDNAATDRTSEVVARHGQRANFAYVRQPRNIGANANFVAVVEAACGEYCWIFGDDEVMLPGAIARVLHLLDTWAPDLLHVSTDGLRVVEEAVAFDGLVPFVGHFARVRPRTLVDVTLITTAIFRRAMWQAVPRKERFFPTLYTQALVLASGLSKGGSIVLVPDAVIAVRTERPPSPEVPSFSIRLLHQQYLAALVHLTGSRELLRYYRRERLRCAIAAARGLVWLTRHYVAEVLRLTGFTLRAMLLRRRAVATRLALAEAGRER